MTSSSSNVVRRARPLLGTLVEITVGGSTPPRAAPAIEAAFAAVERVHRLMSFHEAASDVSRLNRCAAREPVAVDPWTFAVLRESLELSRISDGAFDVTVGSELVRWELLPPPGEAGPSKGEGAGSWADLELLPLRRVRFRRPLIIDLGGIAQGFAVDRAIEPLRTAGMPWAVVNAGGDLRVFGDR